MRPAGEGFREHAIRRARERYGVELTVLDYAWLCSRIARRDPTCVEFVVRQTGAVTVWWVDLAGTRLLCVWDELYGAVMTILDERTRFRADGSQDRAANHRAGIPGALRREVA